MGSFWSGGGTRYRLHNGRARSDYALSGIQYTLKLDNYALLKFSGKRYFFVKIGISFRLSQLRCGLSERIC